MFTKTLMLVKAVITLVIVFISIPSYSNEKIIKIGYSYNNYGSDVTLYFNVPVTQNIEKVIYAQEGVDHLLIPSGSSYEFNFDVGRLFSVKEVTDNVIKALKSTIFKDKLVEVFQLNEKGKSRLKGSK